jgi:16S rRNA (cytosine1402-N4)-methyltransferase
MPIRHPTAMLTEALDWLNCQPGKIYVDGTLGGAGHARGICERIGAEGRFIGIDQDPAAVRNAEILLSSFTCQRHLFHDNFQHLPRILRQLHIPAVDGILLDLGLSLYQLEASGRGFSFMREDEPLDMRMNPDDPTTARDLVNQLDVRELAHIFKVYGEERFSRRIAEGIMTARNTAPLRTSGQLVKVIMDAVPTRSAARQRIHPATRVFMALRIAVNRELEVLRAFLDTALACLAPGGRLCVLSFHSLEDREVKQHMKLWASGCTCPKEIPVCVCGKQPQVHLLTRKAMRPTTVEVERNPLARSTRLRAVEKR